MASEDKPDPLPAAVAALQRLADAFAERREQLAHSAGLSEAQWRVLEEIASEDFMPSLFARRRSRSPAAVSKVIRQLLDRELIEVGIADGDARQRRYRLTQAGRAAMHALRRSRERAVERQPPRGVCRLGSPTPQNTKGPPRRACIENAGRDIARHLVRVNEFLADCREFR